VPYHKQGDPNMIYKCSIELASSTAIKKQDIGCVLETLLSLEDNYFQGYCTMQSGFGGTYCFHLTINECFSLAWLTISA
jgi:hypothetical protein